MFHLIDSRKCLTHLIVLAVQETHLEFLFTRDIWILSLSRMSHLIGIVCCNKPQVMLSPLLSFSRSPVLHTSSQSASFELCLSLQQSYEETSQIKSKVCFRQQLQDCCIVFMTHDCWWCCCEADDGRRGEALPRPQLSSCNSLRDSLTFLTLSLSVCEWVCPLAKWMPFSGSDKHSQTPRQTLRQTVITLLRRSGGKSYTSLSKFQAIYTIWLCNELCLHLDMCCTYD